MLTLNIIGRIGKRAISSVVPKTDLEVTDFKVINEPILGYMPGSQERTALEASLAKYSGECEDIPIIIGGKEYRTDNVQYHDHSKKIAKFYWATPELVAKLPIDEKIQMFLRVSDQMADIYRADLNATIMLGQAKTIVQV